MRDCVVGYIYAAVDASLLDYHNICVIITSRHTVVCKGLGLKQITNC